MAQQALTTAAATACRFTLGIGLSHKIVIEDMLGFSYAKPAKHMREYLSVLMPLVRGETVAFQGDEYRVNGVQMTIPGADGQSLGAGSLPVVVAGLASGGDSTPVYMGANYRLGPGFGGHFDGDMDEFRLYNVALSDTDVMALYQSSQPAPPPATHIPPP